jgi:hypothetical protein
VDHVPSGGEPRQDGQGPPHSLMATPTAHPEARQGTATLSSHIQPVSARLESTLNSGVCSTAQNAPGSAHSRWQHEYQVCPWADQKGSWRVRSARDRQVRIDLPISALPGLRVRKASLILDDKVASDLHTSSTDACVSHTGASRGGRRAGRSGIRDGPGLQGATVHDAVHQREHAAVPTPAGAAAPRERARPAAR